MVRKMYLNKAKHNAEMMKSLDEMRNSGEHCDFTIKVGKERFRVHRNIISAASEYFRAMFRHYTLESQRGEVQMNDLDYECVKSCIDYIYTAEFDLPDGKMEDLLHAAHIMQLKSVSEEVSNILESSLNMENYFRMRRTAKLYNLKSLLFKCGDFEKRNLFVLSKQPEFQNEEKRYILGVLNLYKTTCSEKQKLEVALNWAAIKKDRRKNFIDFLKFIKLNAMSPEYLKKLIETHPLITNDPDLLEVFYRAHKESMKKMLSGSKNDQERKLILFDSNANALKTLNPDGSKVFMSSKANFSHFRHFTAVSLDSVIYILCYNQTFYRLDFRKNDTNWERLENMITDHGYLPPVVSSHNSLVVIGFGLNSIPSGAIELYQTVSEKWVRLEDKPTPVRDHSLTSLGDTIYCVGGSNGKSEITDAFCKLDLNTFEWTDLEPMRNKKACCTSAAVHNKIFIFGGYRDGITLDEVECYDVVTAHWQTLLPMTRSLKFGIVQHVDDKIIVGRRGGKSDELMKYDISYDRWHKLKVKETTLFQVRDMIIIHI